MNTPSYPTPGARKTVVATSEPAADVPATLPVGSPHATSTAERAGNSHTPKAAAAAVAPAKASKKEGGAAQTSDAKKKQLTPEEVAAAAAAARRTLQQPRYVAIAEEEQRAKEAAEERRRQALLLHGAGHVKGSDDDSDDDGNSGDGNSGGADGESKKEQQGGRPKRGSVVPMEKRAAEGRGGEQVMEEKRGEEQDGDEQEPGPRRLSGPPILYLNEEKAHDDADNGDNDDNGEAGPKAKSSSPSSGTAGSKKMKAAKKGRGVPDASPSSEPPQQKSRNGQSKARTAATGAAPDAATAASRKPDSLLAKAEQVVMEKEASEAKALRAGLASVKALLKQFGISANVVPVVPLAKCSACDYCILFSDRESIESHLPHVVRALCVAGMKVTYTAPLVKDKPKPADGEKSEKSEVAKPEGGEEEVLQRRLRNMYCFQVEVVPVSGDVEVVSVHVSLRPGMHDIFYSHYIAYYNGVGEGAVGHNAVDKPFPEDVADLTDAQKKRLLYLVLTHLIHERAAVPQDASSVSVFPAHVDAVRDKIWQDCIGGSKPWHLWKLLQGTDEGALAAYFGEETMFYFAWMNHYQRWLAAASVFTIIAMALGHMQSVNGATDAGSAAGAATAAATSAVVLLDPQTTARAALTAARAINGSVLNATAATAAALLFQTVMPEGDSVASASTSSPASTGAVTATASGSATTTFALPLFLLLLILGSVLCIKMWERRCNTLCMRFKLFQSAVGGKDEVRPEFRGTKGRNPITGDAELQFPGWVRGLVLQPISWLIIAMFAGLTIFLMVCFVNLEGYTAVDGGETGGAGFATMPALRRFSLPGRLLNKADHPILGLIPTVLYSACIGVLSATFKTLAEKLTDFENYKYRGEYIRALTQKRIVFEFINSYAKLFFLALVRQRITDLSTSLKVIFFTSVFTRLIVDTVIPFMKTHREQVSRRLRRRSDKHGNDSDGKAQEKADTLTTSGVGGGHGGSTDSALDEYDELLATYEVYSDYVEMAIQFGYIVLFAVAFPLAPLVAFLSNIIEVRSDLFKLCYVVRRPVPRLGLLENHTWVGVFRVMAIASVMTNMILFAVSATPLIAQLLPSCFAYRYSTSIVDDTGRMAVVATPVLIKGMGRYAVFSAVAVEHLVLGVAVFLFWRISAFPKRVSVHIERKQYARMKAASAAAK